MPAPARAWRLVIFRCREPCPRSSACAGRHDNLGDVDADVLLWRTVAVAGVSGSGETSLAIGTLTAGDFDGY